MERCCLKRPVNNEYLTEFNAITSKLILTAKPYFPKSMKMNNELKSSAEFQNVDPKKVKEFIPKSTNKL